MQFARVRSKDHVGALILVILGAAITLAARNYRIGSLTQMGAGYIPVVIGILFIVVGVLIALTSKAPAPKVLLAPEVPLPQTARGIDPRGAACILGGIAAFVLLGKYGGLVPASFACILISALGDRANSLRDAFLLALGLTVAGYLIFSLGLKISLAPFSWG